MDRRIDVAQLQFIGNAFLKYDVKPNLNKGLLQRLNAIQVFMETCMVMSDTVAWDSEGNRDVSKCIDIDPETLYELPAIDENIA